MLKSEIKNENDGEQFPQLRKGFSSGDIYLFESASSKGIRLKGKNLGNTGVPFGNTSLWYGEITLKQE